MGLFSKIISCTSCRAQNAVKSWFKVSCPTYGCVNFNQEHGAKLMKLQRTATKVKSANKPSWRKSVKVREGDVEVSYVNHRSERKTFTASARTTRDRGRFLSLCVKPENRRISLRKSQIQNVNGDQDLVDFVKAFI